MAEALHDASLSPRVLVVGGGPAGRAAAIAAAAAGLETVLLAPPVARPDNRTTALLQGSVKALEVLGVWPTVSPRAAPLRVMRLVDDTRRLVRAPTVAFEAAEIGLEAFGWNVVNADLVAAMAARAADLPQLTTLAEMATDIAITETGVTVTTDAGRRITAPVLLAADGRRSPARTAAGITTTTSRLPQTALSFDASHTAPHDDISTEFHTEQGPCVFVPLPGLRSSIVCVVSPAEAERLMALDDAALSREIERRAHSILGRMTVESRPVAWPLAIETATRFAANRVMLIGEAAHVIPPIGAQGLNLGLRDAATAAELVAEAFAAGEDPGHADVLADYDRRRRFDIGSRTFAVGLLNRSLISPLLPVSAMRGAALYALDRVAPLRRTVMREGLAPTRGEPRLMQGLPL